MRVCVCLSSEREGEREGQREKETVWVFVVNIHQLANVCYYEKIRIGLNLKMTKYIVP